MRTSNISKHLYKVFNDFAKTISDRRVRRLVRNNTIISGGCITSMLLDEKVNDYDLYFTNKETALEVAKYFINMHNEATGDCVKVFDEDNRVVVYVPSSGEVQEDYEEKGIQTFDSDGEMLDFLNDLEPEERELNDKDLKKHYGNNSSKKYRPIYITSNAITLTNKIQLVMRFYGMPDVIHETFDFVHCTCTWTSWNNELTLPPKALECILSKELIYQGSKYPICSIIRTRKFINRGWIINAGQYLKMCYQVSKLNLDDIRVLEEQLVGVDSAYFSSLITELKRQPNDLSSRIPQIIDRVFS